MTTQLSKVGPFVTWWKNFVLPISLETFEHDGRQYALCYAEDWISPWRLECVFRDRGRNWGNSGRAFATRDKLDAHMEQKGIKVSQQLTLGI